MKLLIFIGSCGVEGEDDSYDFGTGAGFYIDATEEKWKKNYRMYSYITKEVSAGSEGTVGVVKAVTILIVNLIQFPGIRYNMGVNNVRHTHSLYDNSLQ